MIYSIFPTKDATLFSKVSSSPNKLRQEVNTGIDEILFIEKVVSESLQPGTTNTRIVMQFDVTSISSSIAAGSITNPTFYLNLYTSEAEAIPYEYTLEVKPISESWDMGIGRTIHNPKTKEGVSWKYRFGETDGTQWSTLGGTTGSNGNIHTQSFVFESTDVRIDVSASVADWISGTENNYGFLIMRSSSQETDANRYGSLKFFSVDTHTIYVPKLEVAWDDSSFETGSLSALSADNITLYMKDCPGSFKENARARFRIVGRETYPVKTYTTRSAQLTVKYLPETTYYSVMDAQTEDVVIPFSDTYTKVSCDSEGNYFNLWLDGLQPERYYKFVFKVENRVYSGQVELFDNNYIFKVIR